MNFDAVLTEQVRDELRAVSVTVAAVDGSDPVPMLLERVASAVQKVMEMDARFRSGPGWSLFEAVTGQVFGDGQIDAVSDRCPAAKARLFAVVAVFEVVAGLTGESLEARLSVI